MSEPIPSGETYKRLKKEGKITKGDAIEELPCEFYDRMEKEKE